MKYFFVSVILLFSVSAYADGHEEKPNIFEAKKYNDVLKGLGKVSFVYMCKENNKRYVLVLSKGNQEGYMFYLRKNVPRLFTDILISDGIHNQFIETFGGIYTINYAAKLYDKLIQGNFRIFENFTIEMVWDMASLSPCDPPIGVIDPYAR